MNCLYMKMRQPHYQLLSDYTDDRVLEEATSLYTHNNKRW